MSDKYKTLFFNYIYNKLNLNSIENELLSNGIQPIDQVDNISKYFGLLNNVNEEVLTGDLLEKYKYYMSMEIDNLVSDEMRDEVNNFLESTYRLLLFRDSSNPYYYYGPINYSYMAPYDSVVLSFYYNEFGTEESYSDEWHYKNMSLIVDMANNIQEKIGPSNSMKVSVIMYNEFSSKKKIIR